MTFQRKLFLGVTLLAGGCARVPQAPLSARRLPPPGLIVMAPPSSEVLAQRSAGPPAAAVLQTTDDLAWRAPRVTPATPSVTTSPPGQAEARRARRVLRWQQRMTAAVALSPQPSPAQTTPATSKPPMESQAVTAAVLGLSAWVVIPAGILLIALLIRDASLGTALVVVIGGGLLLITAAGYLVVASIVVGASAKKRIRDSQGQLRGMGWANVGFWSGIGLAALFLLTAISSRVR